MLSLSSHRKTFPFVDLTCKIEIEEIYVTQLPFSECYSDIVGPKLWIQRGKMGVQGNYKVGLVFEDWKKIL